MSKEEKNNPFNEENLVISSKNKQKKDKDKKIPLIKQSDSNKNDIIIELSPNKKEEDEKSSNSAEFSGQELRNENERNKAKTERTFKNTISKYQKAYDKYNQKMKEKTMRMEIEKMDKETERLKKIYDEKNSFFHFFDNSPQYQKMLKLVENQLISICILGVIIGIFSGIIYFYLTDQKMGIALANFALALSELAIFAILFISLKLGLLNDPNLSKAFRLFIIIEFLILIGLFIINILMAFFIGEYIDTKDLKFNIIFYIIFGLIMISFVIIIKFSFVLFYESLLILLNKKTEYSILIINEKNSKSDIVENLTSSNNISTEGLMNTSTGIISQNEKKSLPLSKEEEQYRNFKYFNRFHYSVTTVRKDDKYFK